MSDAGDATDGTRSPPIEGHATGLGVVDPLRVPGVDVARSFWTRLPFVGRVILVAAAIDLLVRLSGVAGLPGSLDLGVPLAFVLFSLAHYAVVLFPVVLLARRPDAAAATPQLLLGAVVLASVELLSGPLGIWLSPAGGDITGWTLLQLVIALATSGAYLALALGLRALGQAIPSPSVAGLANLVGGVFALAAVVGALAQVMQPATDFGVPEWGTGFLLAGIAAQLVLLAYANLARTIIRGATDPHRHRAATMLAAGAMTLSGMEAFFTLAFAALLVIQTVFAISAPVLDGGFAFLGGPGGLVTTALVVAFGLGLGDTSVRIPKSSSAQSRESQA